MALVQAPVRDPADPPAGFRGPVLRPGADGYDRARRIHNGALDPRPAVIAPPLDAADVRAAVAHAGAVGLDLVIRSGGHSMAGDSAGDGALVLDLSTLRDIELDVPGRTAWAGGGVLAGDYTRAAQAHGLATPFGDTGSVGVAGITLGGGMGWLSRRLGMTIDSLLAAEVVTADGRLLIASADDHPELFWALRGGGGNFGVVTRLRFQLHPLGDVLAGDIILPATREVLRALVPTLLAAPEELTAMPSIMTAPPDPRIPAEMQGRPVVYCSLVWSGAPEAAAPALAALRGLATPIADTVVSKPYPDLFSEGGDAESQAWGVASRTVFVDALDDALIDVILGRLASPSATEALVQLRVLGGAVARMPNAATAYGWRDRPVAVWLITPFADLDRAPDHEAWTEAFAGELRARIEAPAGAYVNFMGAEDGDAVRAAYPPATLERLRDVKRRYDPDNRFRANRNIAPA